MEELTREQQMTLPSMVIINGIIVEDPMAEILGVPSMVGQKAVGLPEIDNSEYTDEEMKELFPDYVPSPPPDVW